MEEARQETRDAGGSQPAWNYVSEGYEGRLGDQPAFERVLNGRVLLYFSQPYQGSFVTASYCADMNDGGFLRGTRFWFGG